jgi:hypothetical protein
MPDFSFSYRRRRVRSLKSLDYSLNRSSKDFEKNKLSFDFHLDVSFQDLKFTDSFPRKKSSTLWVTTLGQEGALGLLWSRYLGLPGTHMLKPNFQWNSIRRGGL